MSVIGTYPTGAIGAIIEKDGKILLVKEHRPGRVDHDMWSHPAGRLEVGENPLEGVRREVQEETGYVFTPTHLLGVYSLIKHYMVNGSLVTPHPLKFIYLGTISEKQEYPLADDISEIAWFSPEEIYAMSSDILRDMDIKIMVKHYFEGKKFSLDVITHTTFEETLV